jgi:hypothetical protein
MMGCGMEASDSGNGSAGAASVVPVRMTPHPIAQCGTKNDTGFNIWFSM